MTTKKKNLMGKLLISIINGMYKEGDKLPSLRKYAKANDASLYTTLNVYNELAALGVIESRPKMGYFVAKSDYETLYSLGRSIIGFSPTQQTVRFHYDKSDFDSFAFDQYVDKLLLTPAESCHQLSWSCVGDEYFGGAAGGFHAPERLKEVEDIVTSRIALWMLGYGCHFLTRHITVTNNAVEALTLAIRACHNTEAPDDYVLAIESPGSKLFGYCARFLSIKYKEIRSDPDTGLCVDDLARHIDAGTKFSAVVLSTCNADPTGAVMPEQSKKRLVELCRKNGIAIVEYDEYGHFCLTRRQHPPLKVLDHELVVYVCDLGKIFGLNLPLAFVESGQYTKMLRFLKNFSGIRVPMDMQRQLAALLDTDTLAGHIEKCRERIDHTAKMFTEIVRGIVPESVRIRRAQGSPFLWIELPEGGKSMRAFLELALSRNVYVAPSPIFSSLPEYGRCFRVNCCATKKPKQIAAGAKALGQVIAEFVMG